MNGIESEATLSLYSAQVSLQPYKHLSLPTIPSHHQVSHDLQPQRSIRNYAF